MSILLLEKMMNRKFHTVCVIATMFFSQNVFPQINRTTTKVGTTVAGFLKIPAGARSIALGGGATAVEGDVYSMYWNPSALARLKTPGETSFNHAQWLADVEYNFLASGMTIEGFGAIGFTVTSLSVPDDIVRTEINPDGDGRRWGYSALAMGVSFARSLTDRFSIGFTGKYIHEGIWNMSAQGFAIDIGTIYTTTFNNLKIGASISNFGTKMQLDGQDITFNNFPGGEQGQGAQNVESKYKTEAYDIPLLFRFGISVDVLQMDDIRATATVDAVHPNDNTEYLNSGLEIGYDEMFFGRIGYKSLFMQDTEEGLTWGFGVNILLSNTTGIKFDYAVADYGRLNDVQYLTVGITY